MKIPMDKKYQCPKWKNSIWGLYEGLYRSYLTNKKSFQRRINASCFRDWIWRRSWRAIIAMLLCPHWWIWNITFLIRRTCQFWEPKMWWRYYVKSEIELVQITRRNSWTAPMVVQREHWTIWALVSRHDVLFDSYFDFTSIEKVYLGHYCRKTLLQGC
jgi:hypothetical protein